MIIVITIKERNERSGKEEIIVSHGVDTITGQDVVLPCVPIREMSNATFRADLNEYVISS